MGALWLAGLDVAVGELGGSVGILARGSVCGECALEEALPVVVWRGGDEGQDDEAQEFDNVEGKGPLLESGLAWWLSSCGRRRAAYVALVCVNDLGEDVGDGGQHGCLEGSVDDWGRHGGSNMVDVERIGSLWIGKRVTR